MRKFREKHPILLSIGVLLTMLLASFIGLGLVLLINAIFPGFQYTGDYTIQLVAEVVVLIILVFLTFLLGMGHVFHEKGVGFFKSMLPAGVLLVYYAYAGLVSVVFGDLQGSLQPPLQIIAFLLCMAAVGLAEELAFRGLITRMIFDKYGHSRSGLWLTVVVSGIIFGCMHLTNGIGGVIPLAGVLIQVLGATALGMCLSAIYIRCRNLWAVAAIHGFMDFCALISSGIFASTTIAETVGSYTPEMLSSLWFYGGIAAFLLRKSKLPHIKEAGSHGTVIKLALSLLFLLGMITAVLVLTL